MFLRITYFAYISIILKSLIKIKAIIVRKKGQAVKNIKINFILQILLLKNRSGARQHLSSSIRDKTTKKDKSSFFFLPSEIEYAITHGNVLPFYAK